MVRSRPLLSLVLVLPMLLVPLASAHVLEEEQPPHPDVLYLWQPDPIFGTHNFTTYPAAADEAGSAVAPFATLSETYWLWSVSKLPTRWTVTDETPLLLHAYVSGFDKALPQTLPGDGGTVRFVFDVEMIHYTSGGTRFASGTGELVVDPLNAPTGPVELRVPLEVERTVAFQGAGAGADGFLLRIEPQTVKAPPESPLRLHIGAADTPSRLVVPDFPVIGFRAWEDGMEPSLCRYRSWQGQECADDDPTAPHAHGPAAKEQQSAESPIPMFMPLLVALAAGLVGFVGRHRRS